MQIASKIEIKRISLGTSPLIYPIDFSEDLAKQTFNKNLIPYFPLSGLDGNVFESAKEIGLEKYLPNIKKLGNTKFHSSKQPTKETEKIVLESIKNKKTVSVKIGLNNVHEILDEVRSEH